MEEKMRSIIADVLDKKLGYYRQPDGTFSYEIDADYRDEMDSKTATKILQSSDPLGALWEQLDEWYGECEWELRDELKQELIKELTEDEWAFPEGFTGEAEDLLHELILEMVQYQLPEEHFLKQEFNINIMLDTGDGNHDFTLNSPYPCWYGDYDARLHEKSALLWLARQQGFNKTQLWRALREEDTHDPKGFLESCRVECANLASHMATVTFLVRMTLEDLMELNRLVQHQDVNGHQYDATKNPYCGYVTLDKDTMCGLFDPWHGGGSVLEIQLERDVRIPIKYIWSAFPDGHGHGHYDVGEVYDMCGSAWQQGGIKTIHAPLKLTA